MSPLSTIHNNMYLKSESMISKLSRVYELNYTVNSMFHKNVNPGWKILHYDDKGHWETQYLLTMIF